MPQSYTANPPAVGCASAHGCRVRFANHCRPTFRTSLRRCPNIVSTAAAGIRRWSQAFEPSPAIANSQCRRQANKPERNSNHQIPIALRGEPRHQRESQCIAVRMRVHRIKPMQREIPGLIGGLIPQLIYFIPRKSIDAAHWFKIVVSTQSQREPTIESSSRQQPAAHADQKR